MTTTFHWNPSTKPETETRDRSDHKFIQSTMGETQKESKRESQSTSVSTTQTITKYGGLVKCGDIDCSVQLLMGKNRTSLLSGQKSQLNVSVLNRSTVSVKAIGVDLVQKSHYYAKPQHDYGDIAAAHAPHANETSKTLWTTNFSLNGSLEHALSSDNKNLEAPRTPEYEEGKANSCQYTFTLPPVPEKALKTFYGKNHYIRHQLKVTLITESIHSNIVMKIPVTIGCLEQGSSEGFRSSRPSRATTRFTLMDVFSAL